MDAHDEAAKALKRELQAFCECDYCERMTDATEGAHCVSFLLLRNALRKAAADERHAILLMVQDEINPADTGRDSYHYASCAEALFLRIQARAKGGA